MEPRSYVLIGGPQDGAKIRHMGDRPPVLVFVGPRWLGDGFAAWGHERCARFPCCYRLY